MKDVSTSCHFSLNSFLSVLAFVCGTSISFGQGTNFELITGTLKSDDGKCIIQTLDSGYVLIGSTSGMGMGQKDIYLSKISKAGKVSWQQAIGGSGIDIGNSVLQTSDSGYVVAGYSNSGGNGGYDVYLAKTDKEGALLWEKYYGGFDWDFGNSLIQTSAGDLVVCGSTYSYGNGNGDVYLLKTDADGVLAWDSAYGGSLEDAGNSVCPTNDGGYFIAGQTKSYGMGDADVYLLKSDSNGNLKWGKTYGGTGSETGNECKLTADGRNIVICSSNSFSPNGKYENWLMKINALGDTLWSRRDTANFNRFGTSIIQTADGGYMFTGHADNALEYNMYLYKTDATGYWQSYESFGGGGKENAFSVKQTFDKGYVVLGTTESYGNGKPNLYVLKTDSNRVSTGVITIVVGMSEFQPKTELLAIYPNPADEYFFLHEAGSSQLEIYDQLGRIVYTAGTIKGKNTILTSQLPEGIYIVQLKGEDMLSRGKLNIRH